MGRVYAIYEAGHLYLRHSRGLGAGGFVASGRTNSAPTGVLDPVVEVVPAKNQVDDLIDRLRSVVEKGERALVTTLTKRSAEDMAEYLADLGFKVRYIHSELDTFERAEAIRDLRMGEISVLVGVNLLREGLDLPEVTLVAILDADREASCARAALYSMIGRAARNTASIVVLYADEETGGLRRAVEETRRRRKIQERYNEEHGIVRDNKKGSVIPSFDLKPSASSARKHLQEKAWKKYPSLNWSALCGRLWNGSISRKRPKCAIL